MTSVVQGGQCGTFILALADRFLLAVIGPEDGGIKASPVPSDPEKPSTPGEGMLSSDLDRISTEGEAVTCTLHVSGSFVGERESPAYGTFICIVSLVGSPGHLPWP